MQELKKLMERIDAEIITIRALIKDSANWRAMPSSERLEHIYRMTDLEYDWDHLQDALRVMEKWNALQTS